MCDKCKLPGVICGMKLPDQQQGQEPCFSCWHLGTHSQMCSICEDYREYTPKSKCICGLTKCPDCNPPPKSSTIMSLLHENKALQKENEELKKKLREHETLVCHKCGGAMYTDKMIDDTRRIKAELDLQELKAKVAEIKDSFCILYNEIQYSIHLEYAVKLSEFKQMLEEVEK